MSLNALFENGRGSQLRSGEPVLTQRVTQNPLLLLLASRVNQLASGRPLVPGYAVPRITLGGVTQPLIQQQLRGDAGLAIDYGRLAQAVSKLQVKATISDVNAGLERKAFTESQSNS